MTSGLVRWVGALTVLAGLAGAGCSSSDGEPEVSEGSASLEAPAFGGSFDCVDEVGDQLDGTVDAESPAVVPDPGTDLVEGRVEVVDEELVVTFITDRPAVPGDGPRFVVAKGLQAEPATWFEVRAFVSDGEWVVERRRLPTQLNAEGFAQERVDTLATPVEVDDTTVRVAVPLDQLPAIDGTPTWQFGSASSDGSVFDDCNELTE